jgi:hypothetical protein
MDAQAKEISDGTGDLSLLRYTPDFVINLFVINELYLIRGVVNDGIVDHHSLKILHS